ncbi:acetylxylan esterase [Vibrio hannami]|uniref:acetylxylan esterase n=1 Tax=Vibrio hannami TaxID=2717094 RepID=UPI0024105E88|nr:acetylxylan esterase [Vibrio hannami]MDG3086073.1 acetylxylan esterase [Vibrio hannami]
MPRKLKHDYDFDPGYGYTLGSLLKVPPGKTPAGFVRFWRDKYQQALQVKPYLNLQDTGVTQNNWRIFNCYYDSTDNTRIGGWLLLPDSGRVNGAVVFAHGYGGIEEPDTSWNLENTAILFPCSRGIGRSEKQPISDEPKWHVLHDIQDKDRYIIGGCVQDLWCGVSALLSLFPQLGASIGLAGSSFGGGLGVFATAFDERISRAHFHVPTFGNLNIRMKLPSHGSTESLREFSVEHPDLIKTTLPYFDASCAAKYITKPSHWGLAYFDPFVAPPGQYSIYNNCQGDKLLFKLKAGHFVYVGEGKQRREMRREVESFFSVLGASNAS